MESNLTVHEQRWARRNAKLQQRIADIPSRFTNDALYEPAPVGQGMANAEVEFFGTSFTVFEKQVKKAAKTVAQHWPGILTEEDAEQELWLKLIESKASIVKLRDDFDDKNRLNALIQMGHQIGNKALEDYQIATGKFRYCVNTVKDILNQTQEPTDKLPTRTAKHDLKMGMKALAEKNAGYADAVIDRYVNGKVPVAGSAAVRLSRALTALTTHMNRAHRSQHVSRSDGPGTRKIVRRRAAQVKSSQQYDGSHDGWLTDWTAGKLK